MDMHASINLIQIYFIGAIQLLHGCLILRVCMDDRGGGGVQGFRLKFRDFGQPVQGSALSRLASMFMVPGPFHKTWDLRGNLRLFI